VYGEHYMCIDDWHIESYHFGYYIYAEGPLGHLTGLMGGGGEGWGGASFEL
jgi:hypothetical protein